MQISKLIALLQARLEKEGDGEIAYNYILAEDVRRTLAGEQLTDADVEQVIQRADKFIMENWTTDDILWEAWRWLKDWRKENAGNKG